MVPVITALQVSVFPAGSVIVKITGLAPILEQSNELMSRVAVKKPLLSLEPLSTSLGSTKTCPSASNETDIS